MGLISFYVQFYYTTVTFTVSLVQRKKKGSYDAKYSP